MPAKIQKLDSENGVERRREGNWPQILRRGFHMHVKEGGGVISVATCVPQPICSELREQLKMKERVKICVSISLPLTTHLTS